MAISQCKIIAWKDLPSAAKVEFPHQSAMDSEFFKFKNEWYCVGYLDGRSQTHDFENDTPDGTFIACNRSGNVMEVSEFTEHVVPNLAQLLSFH